MARHHFYNHYDVTTTNCAWMAIDVMKKGKITKKENNALKNMQYTHINSSGIDLYKTIIPNIGFKKASKIFKSKIHTIS